MHERTTPVDLIGSAEASDLLGIDRSTLTRKVARGEIEPAGRLGTSGALIFRRDAITRAKEGVR